MKNLKIVQKITIALLVAIVVLASFLMGNVFASVTIANGDSNSTVVVTRNVTGVTNSVTNTFGYTITQDTSYNNTTVTGYPSTLSIAFDGTETITSNTVTKSATLNFAGATFTDVGDYRFIITETSSTNSTKYPTASETYYLYVSVRYDENLDDGTMIATVASTGIEGSTTYDSASKESVVFEEGTNLTNISISKTVTGNMGDKSQYFDVTVTVVGESGETYAVSGGSYAGNPATVSANTATVLKIKHGETITIGASSGVNQIATGVSYTVAEAAVTNYTTTIDGNEVATTTKTTVATAANNETEIVNDYDSAVLTGIFYNVMPFVAIFAGVIILIIVLKKSSRKDD